MFRPRKGPVTDQERWELGIQSAPDYYTAVAHRGGGRNEKREGKKFEDALALARTIIFDRPVMIYAIRGESASHVVNLVHQKQEFNMAILVTYSGYLKHIMLGKYVSRDHAESALKRLDDPAISGMVVEAEGDVTGSLSFLKDLYNGLTQEGDEPIKAFSQKSEGQRRVMIRLERNAAALPGISVEAAVVDTADGSTTEEKEADMATKKTKTPRVKKEKAPRVARVKKEKVVREPGAARNRIDKSAVIKSVADNPKRPSSAAFERYKKYTVGQTVQKFLDKGGWLADVRWDVAQGFVKLGKAE